MSGLTHQEACARIGICPNKVSWYICHGIYLYSPPKVGKSRVYGRKDWLNLCAFSRVLQSGKTPLEAAAVAGQFQATNAQRSDEDNSAIEVRLGNADFYRVYRFDVKMMVSCMEGN